MFLPQEICHKGLGPLIPNAPFAIQIGVFVVIFYSYVLFQKIKVQMIV